MIRWNATLAGIVKEMLYDAGFCVITLATGIVLLRLKRYKWAFRLLILSLLVLSVPCLYGMVELAARPLKTKADLPQPCLREAKAMVVLSGGVLSADFLTESTHQRVMTAAAFVEAKGSRPFKLKRVIFSGGYNKKAKAAESVVMMELFKKEVQKEILNDLIVITEEESRNTFENAKFSRETLMEEETIILVTSDYHMPRALRVFEKMGLDVCPLPAPSHDLSSFGVWNFGNGSNFSRIVNEYLGIVGYWLVGWI